jgi:hypothetical protein
MQKQKQMQVREHGCVMVIKSKERALSTIDVRADGVVKHLAI